MSNENGGTSGFLVFLVFIAVLTLIAVVVGFLAGVSFFTFESVLSLFGSELYEALVT